MNKPILEQKGAIGSQNTQIGEQNNYYGLTVNEAMDIALKLFYDNFPKLQNMALETVEKRINEFTEDFFKKLAEDKFERFEKFVEPAIQYSLYEAQKEYAKSGDENIKYNLINILSARLNHEYNTSAQIIFDEAIIQVTKLTKDQVDFLSLMYILFNMNKKITNLQALDSYIRENVLIFSNTELPSQFFQYLTLQTTNCVAVLHGGNALKPFEEWFLENKTGLFSRGFTKEEFESNINANVEKYSVLLLPCLHDNRKLQFNVMNRKTLEDKIIELNWIMEKDKILNLYQNTNMNASEVRQYLINVDSRIKNILNFWGDSRNPINNLVLTPVGMAIAITNLNKKTDEKISLSEFFGN